MRLNIFLSEGRTKEIKSRDEVVSLIKKNCMNSLIAYVKGRATLYRGVNAQVYWGYINPKTGNPRGSAFEKSNHYTHLIDNLPSWKKYPKRSRSIIMTTDLSNATERSGDKPFIVLPYNNSNLAVCPNDDIWFSFPNIDMDREFNNLSDLNSWFRSNNIPDTNMEKVMKKITNKNYPDSFNNTTDYTGKLKDWKHMGKEMTLWDWFNDVMSPNKNGFELIKSGKAIHYSVEVWTDGECILVEDSSGNESMLKEIAAG